MELVKPEVSQLALQEVMQVFGLCVIFEGEVDILKAFVQTLSDNLDRFGISNELMTEADPQDLQLGVKAKSFQKNLLEKLHLGSHVIHGVRAT